MTVSLPSAVAQTCQTNNKALEACDQALRSAEGVISRQDDLIVQINLQNNSLKDENEELQRAIVRLDEEVGDSWKSQAIVGGLGLAVGITLGVLLSPVGR